MSEHLEGAADHSALAAILAARGRHREAREALRAALSAFEDVLGPDHYEVALTLDELAGMARHGGDVTEAAALYERSLEIKQRLFGARHPEVARTRHALAACRNPI